MSHLQKETAARRIQERLLGAGFEKELNRAASASRIAITLGEEASGFYAEFLTPLIGRSVTKSGKQLATVEKPE